VDRARNAHSRGRGFRLVRFWNHDIVRNIDGVLETLPIVLADGRDPRE